MGEGSGEEGKGGAWQGREEGRGAQEGDQQGRAFPPLSSSLALADYLPVGQAKKLQKKGAEWEKDARATAKKYPVAASGIVGIANLAVVAAVGFVAYQNWDKPSWDRKTVSLVSVGLLGLFGAEG